MFILAICYCTQSMSTIFSCVHHFLVSPAWKQQHLELWILSSNQKLEVALVFQKDQSTGHQKRLILHQTNFDWYHLISHHKMLFYNWKPSVQIRDWHSYGHRPSSILGKPLSAVFWIWICLAMNVCRIYTCL